MFLHIHNGEPVMYPETGECPHEECVATRLEIQEIITKDNGHTTTCTCPGENQNPNIVLGEN